MKNNTNTPPDPLGGQESPIPEQESLAPQEFLEREQQTTSVDPQGEKPVKKPHWNTKPDPTWKGHPSQNWSKERAQWMAKQKRRILKYAYSDVARAINRRGATKQAVKNKLRFIDRENLLELVEFILCYRAKLDENGPFPKVVNDKIAAKVFKNFTQSYIRPPLTAEQLERKRIRAEAKKIAGKKITGSIYTEDFSNTNPNS